MRTILLLILLSTLSCQQQNNFDPNLYYDKAEQDRILAGIIAHIFTPPPYVPMEERLKKEHRNYYFSLTPKFSLQKLFVDNSDKHYFLVERPGPGRNHRAVAGSFSLQDDELIHFQEIFVTPSLPDSLLRVRSAFLFAELVKGDIGEYLNMTSYVQWPNEGTRYDTTTFEWKIIPGIVYDSTGNTQ